jgi:hypothetical protein
MKHYPPSRHFRVTSALRRSCPSQSQVSYPATVHCRRLALGPADARLTRPQAACIFASNQVLTFAKFELSATDPVVADCCTVSMRALTSSGAKASA